MNDLQRKNRKVFGMLAGVGVVMGSLAWAAVPFYDWFCRVTGYGGTTAVASAASERQLDESILIRFDANKEPGMAWDFKPSQLKMSLKIGETGMAFYEAYNPTDRVIAGTATFNVAPDAAGLYFLKIDCFCFTEQVLQPGERVEMPVTFYVDPDIREDSESRNVKEITLSYTFFETPLPKDELSQLVLEGEKGQTTTQSN
jgi:cytochrome c oxidase assembly protein subunit 11